MYQIHLQLNLLMNSVFVISALVSLPLIALSRVSAGNHLVFNVLCCNIEVFETNAYNKEFKTMGSCLQKLYINICLLFPSIG